MPAYNYRAVDPSGCIVEGSLEAPSERALETQLKQSDMELLRCSERRNRGFGSKRSVSRKDLIGFCFHMQQMTKAGLPILEALADLRDSVEHPVFKEVIANLITGVETGKTLSQAMADYPEIFDDVFVSLISVGEESNNLEEVLIGIADTTERRIARHLELMVRLLEPILLLFMAGITLVVVASLLLPVFKMGTLV